jgi:RimJ/RimL family protein N-acetyltransferase
MNIEAKVLQGRFIRLEPLAEAHYDDLKRACDADPEIWPLYPFSMAGEHFDIWKGAVAKRVTRGEAIAYAVLRDDEIVGVSLFAAIDRPNRRMEIGNTYFRPDVRGGAVNPEAKLLMLAQAFEAGAVCVQLRVDAANARSRAAVAKLGARQDGILRRDRITWTGRMRDTIVFSILDDEWPDIKARLAARLDGFS